MTGIRTADPSDDAKLVAIDAATWTETVSPAPAPSGPWSFFERADPQDVLVAELDGAVAGYAAIGNTSPMPSHQHVLELRGLAVDPAAQGRGVGHLLVEAAVEEARRRGALKITLRVLASNLVARRLYERCGFEVEGVLRGEFKLGGTFVDDVLMARSLA